MLPVFLWLVLAGCVTCVAPDVPPFRLPAIIHVARNWVASVRDPVGALVTRVVREGPSDQNVTFGLDTSGPPVPFAIDPATGEVRVNDTLADKLNRSYLLWVTAFDGSIPQRMEVLATITNGTGYGPLLPRPPFLPTFPAPPAPDLRPDPHTTTKAPDAVETTPEPGNVTQAAAGPTSRPEEPNEAERAPPQPPQPAQPAGEFPLAVVPPVAIGGLVIIVAAVIIFVCRKNSRGWVKKPMKGEKESSGIVLQDATLSPWDRQRANSNRYEAWDNNHVQASSENSIQKEEPVDEWEFPRHRLKMFNMVGEGAFGQVFVAQATDIDGKKGEVTVAVKTLKKNASQDEKTDLLQELSLMKGLGTHPNVVRLIGCCTEKEPTLVIMEFVPLGKLQQFLRDSRAERHYGNTHAGSGRLTSPDLTRFAYQVARGMDFLSAKGIIHRDLAARNVLVSADRVCKVADFGFARDVGTQQVYERKSGGRLPIRWMAPESLYDDIFSVKSDVWSFGVLLWEIVTLGSTPYPGLSAGDVMHKVRAGHRLEKPPHCRRELYNIMYYCWEAAAAARPDFRELATLLDRLLASDTDYIELDRFPDHCYHNVHHLDGEKL